MKKRQLFFVLLVIFISIIFCNFTFAREITTLESGKILIPNENFCNLFNGETCPVIDMTPKHKCCVCSYLEDDRCKNRYWTCSINNGCEWIDNECKTARVIKSECTKWFNENNQKNCVEKIEIPIRYFKDENGQLSIEYNSAKNLESCDDFSGKFIMHGSSNVCKYPFEFALTYIKNLPNIKNLEFDFISCGNFKNTKKAIKYGETEIKPLIKKNQCISISSNQATVSFDKSGFGIQTKYKIIVNSGGVSGKPDICHFGFECQVSGETAFCMMKKNGEYILGCEKCKFSPFSNHWMWVQNYECEKNLS